jgi:hypothetical protein
MSKTLSLSAAEQPDENPTPNPGVPRMEVCDVLVKLGGDLRNEVPVSKVTPAELILLRGVHGGAETVMVQQVTGYSPLSSTAERMRLQAKYPRHLKMISEMFPGLAPQFPMTVAEAEDLAKAELAQAENEMQADPLES